MRHPRITARKEARIIGKTTEVLGDVGSFQPLLAEPELLRDIHKGLTDVEAGRVVPHDEARARLLARYA